MPSPLMWGSEQKVFMPGGIPTVPTAQLARIEHDRPQSWAFLFTAFSPNVLSTPSCDIRFEIAMGLGRSAPIIALARLRVENGGKQVWTTVGYTSSNVAGTFGLIEPVSDTVVAVPVEFFVAQNIQCQAVVENAPSGGGELFVGAYFSPLSHTPWEQPGGSAVPWSDEQ